MSARFALLLVAFGASAAVAGPAPVAPAAAPFKVGTVEVVALRDMSNLVPNDGSVFGVGQPTAAVAAVLRSAGAPTDTIALSVDALLVRLPGRLVLIDTGLGPKVGGVLPASLAQAGVSPAQISDVLITHGHPDHLGGLLGGDGKPAFSNATVRMSAAEWASIAGQPNNAALVAALADRVKPFTPGAEVVPGITSVSLPGHTPGHSGYEIRSGAARLLDIGDTAHSAIVSLARPAWRIGYDGDDAEGRATRKAELAKLAASHELVFAPHFPFPGIGRIAASPSGGYRWMPVSPQASSIRR